MMRVSRRVWPALAVLAACVPFAAGFSLTNIFYIRDLSQFFWPRHLWIRRSLFSGSWPLWDPYVSAGQAVFPDALNQLFLPPALLLRALPAVPGFNLWVALPFPFAALGSWLFLRRHVSDTSAALGAVVFAASGPIVSTANFPNLSWSVAWMPWVLWAADRDRAAASTRSFALLTAIVAFEMLSGEPVTMAGTIALLLAYVVIWSAPNRSVRPQLRAAARVIGSVAVATAIAAVQLVPMVLAARESTRGQLRVDNFWSIHPLWFVESLLPQLFGNTFLQYNTELVWITPLNSGREPFFFSIYIGTIALVLSVLGTLVGSRRWRFFWLTIVVASIVLAFGSYVPVYPVLQWLVPPLRSFRYPAKFLVFASFGVAALAANAADALQGRGAVGQAPALSPRAVKVAIGVAMAIAVMLVIAISLVLVAPFTGARAFYTLAASVGVADPVAGAEYLFKALPPIATRTLIILMTGVLLVYLGWAGGHEDRRARALLFGLAVVELVGTQIGLNPVLPASRLGPPEWTVALAAHPDARFYFGGKFRRGLAEHDIDLRGIAWQAPQGVTVEEGRTLLMAHLAEAPSGWGVRELMSYDLPELWPIDHARAAAIFEVSDRPERMRFLERGGVRYCLLSAAPFPGAARLHRVGEQFRQMAVYECLPHARRAYVVSRAVVVPDRTTQLKQLFDGAFDAESTVMLERPAPDPAGSPGTPSAPSARITIDADQEVAVIAVAGNGGGYLVLADSFDRGWRVEVDGQPATLVRANALYRAVHISAGPHTVVFKYRPRIFYIYLIFSSVAALTVAVIAATRPAWSDRGLTGSDRDRGLTAV